ncbi:MAG TPA: prepilin-type N-terminal cleavage/methylation domain-containing protein [Candidatus Dormibacteraeota bacterium]
MKATLLRYAKDQSGYTLVELIVASAIGLFLMTGLTSVVLTTWRAGTTATSRIEASGQIRNFQFEAYDDFALSNLPTPSGCAATAARPCTTPIVLQGVQASNAANPVMSSYQVTYAWDGSSLLTRQVNSNPAVEAANGVTAFSWYLDGSGSHQTVVVTISVTVQSYTETQTLRFYPRVNP